MKVYLYIKQEDLIVFNGLLADPSYQAEIEYFEQYQPGTLMVSIDIDTFIFFQDNNLLYQTQLIQN